LAVAACWRLPERTIQVAGKSGFPGTTWRIDVPVTLSGRVAALATMA